MGRERVNQVQEAQSILGRIPKEEHTKTQNNQNTQCPLCRTPFSTTDIIQDNELKNEMYNKSIKCECGNIMFLSEYNKHSETLSHIIKLMNNNGYNLFINQDYNMFILYVTIKIPKMFPHKNVLLAYINTEF